LDNCEWCTIYLVSTKAHDAKQLHREFKQEVFQSVLKKAMIPEFIPKKNSLSLSGVGKTTKSVKTAP
jgi:hypothetical protein